MISVIGIDQKKKIFKDLTLSEAKSEKYSWYWVDIKEPTTEEIEILSTEFHFHPLAIEDCVEYVQRPKIDYYEGYHFIILHELNKMEMDENEIDLFVSERFLVSFNLKSSSTLEIVKDQLSSEKRMTKSPLHFLHLIIDRLVDSYFPLMYRIEDELGDLEFEQMKKSVNKAVESLYDIRSDLSKIRRTVLPTRDLLYRILNSSRFKDLSEHRIYFEDIYDHLMKLSDMIEANRDLAADIRESYFSLSTEHMNNIMKTLTIISSFFLPLTFIVGLYGMNFHYMPELSWKYGYAFILLVMGLVTVSMYIFFKRKGWF
ncbi:magnesium/cobalt transporter CorA [Bacillus sp. RG28]|uniref:Magnesium transport protein CorA n=1 Tax=Gottfriedia endophytica TaxID=2820819 RepID=A0A940NLG7_9BACI|nr:magnesium/cobalt transporter CorA [Gottfriedia endophytica]MBP0724716.1 magnesium/cobalt transporter CorA [Gottfriedia endophytica]